MKKLFTKITIYTSIIFVSITGAIADEGVELKQQNWSFNGIFGKYDRASAQRGFQVYREVCAACHGLKYIAFRNLTEIGFAEEMAKAIAAEYQVEDGPDDLGDMFERPGKLSDYLPSPFANENAARASNGGALPPDLSLITKARPQGPNYLYSLLTGYKDAPTGVGLASGMYYNEYFKGQAIAMPAPLFDNQVEYMDGTQASVDQMSQDLVMFLQWAAEPKLENRHEAGFKVMIFLILLTALTYLVNKKVWAPIKDKKD